MHSNNQLFSISNSSNVNILSQPCPTSKKKKKCYSKSFYDPFETKRSLQGTHKLNNWPIVCLIQELYEYEWPLTSSLLHCLFLRLHCWPFYICSCRISSKKKKNHCHAEKRSQKAFYNFQFVGFSLLITLLVCAVCVHYVEMVELEKSVTILKLNVCIVCIRSPPGHKKP